MTKTEYNIYIDGNKIGKSLSYREAIEYVQESYSHILPYLDWEPYLNVDCWENGVNSIKIERHVREINLRSLIDDYQKQSEKYMKESDSEEENEIIDQEVRKRMPYTPKRTNLKTKKNKRVSVKKEGEIMEAEDGKMYISKKKTNGKIGWTRYVPKKYQGPPRKAIRKSPTKPAKEFPEGKVMKGEDGNMWKVKKIKNGTFRWVKDK
jgi:hypothetical protein